MTGRRWQCVHRAGDRKLDWTKPPPRRWTSVAVRARGQLSSGSAAAVPIPDPWRSDRKLDWTKPPPRRWTSVAVCARGQLSSGSAAAVPIPDPWRSDRKLRMLACRAQFLTHGVLKRVAVPHFVSNHGADCIGLCRATGAITSRSRRSGRQGQKAQLSVGRDGRRDPGRSWGKRAVCRHPARRSAANCFFKRSFPAASGVDADRQ